MAAQAANPRDRVMQVIDEESGRDRPDAVAGDPDRERQPQVSRPGLRPGRRSRRRLAFKAEIYRPAPRWTFRGERSGRENAVGVLPRHGRRTLADLQRPRRRRAARRSGGLDGGNPFSGRRRRADLGRGASDMKSGVVAQAFAARALPTRGPTAGRPDPRSRRRRGGHGPRGRRRRRPSSAATRPTRRSSRAERAARAARRRAGRPRPVVVLGHRPRQAHPRVDAGETSGRAASGARSAVNAIDKGVDMFLAMRGSRTSGARASATRSSRRAISRSTPAWSPAAPRASSCRSS